MVQLSFTISFQATEKLNDKNNQESAIFLPKLTREITLISPHLQVNLLDPRLYLLLVTDNANTGAWNYERR